MVRGSSVTSSAPNLDVYTPVEIVSTGATSEEELATEVQVQEVVPTVSEESSEESVSVSIQEGMSVESIPENISVDITSDSTPVESIVSETSLDSP